MARKAIESANVEEKSAAKQGKQEIKSLPAVFTNEEAFRAYIALAVLLNSEEKSNEYNNTLTANKLLTVKQSVDNYAANGIDLEKEFYPVSVNIGGVFCGINRRQRVIFAAGFIGERKLAVTMSTRALKELPELASNEKVAEKFGYAPKYLTRLDANNGTLLPASIDFNHFVENNFGLPFCYSTSKADLLDYAQWLNNKRAFEQYKTAAAAFETVNYDGEKCIADFCAVAKENGFEVYRQDYMKVAFDYKKELEKVLDGENYSAIQKEKARKMLYGDETINASSAKSKTKKAKKTATSTPKTPKTKKAKVEIQNAEIISNDEKGFEEIPATAELEKELSTIFEGKSA